MPEDHRAARVLLTVGQLLISDDHASIDAEHVTALREGLRVDDRLIEVRLVTVQPPVYVIVNGRHRFLAAVLTGARQVDCVLKA